MMREIHANEYARYRLARGDDSAMERRVREYEQMVTVREYLTMCTELRQWRERHKGVAVLSESGPADPVDWDALDARVNELARMCCEDGTDARTAKRTVAATVRAEFDIADDGSRTAKRTYAKAVDAVEHFYGKAA